MKINCSRIVNIFIFFIFIGTVLIITGKIVRAKFIGDSTSIINGFYAEDKNDIDVIVIGSSNSFCTVDPVTLYDEYGIAAYDFGSSSQQMNMSYLYLEEALKKQSPALVVLEVNMLIGDTLDYENDSALRWGYTDIPLSVDKLKSIYEVTGGFNREFVTYAFPIFFYHSRWNELSKVDYTYFYSDKTNYTLGYLETSTVSESQIYMDDYDCDGVAYVDDRNVEYLDKMIELCKKNNADFMLFKSPKENWRKYENQAVRVLADERGVNFVDYNELYFNGELELDKTMDFRDSDHLNDYGAKKVTFHLGGYIKANYDVPDRRGEDSANSWDKASEYRKRKGYQEFVDAASAQECLEMLQDDMNYVIIVTDTGNNKTRQWVYEDCKIKYSTTWEGEGMEHMNIGKSKLVLTMQEMYPQVLIDGVDWFQISGRWNIIVYDKIIGDVVADLGFDV